MMTMTMSIAPLIEKLILEKTEFVVDPRIPGWPKGVTRNGVIYSLGSFSLLTRRISLDWK